MDKEYTLVIAEVSLLGMLKTMWNGKRQTAIVKIKKIANDQFTLVD